MIGLYIIFIIAAVLFYFLIRNYRKGEFTIRQRRHKRGELIGAAYFLFLLGEMIIIVGNDLGAPSDEAPGFLMFFLILFSFLGTIVYLLIGTLPIHLIYTTEGINFWRNWGGLEIPRPYPLDTQMTPLSRLLDRIFWTCGIGMGIIFPVFAYYIF